MTLDTTFWDGRMPLVPSQDPVEQFGDGVCHRREQYHETQNERSTSTTDGQTVANANLGGTQPG